MEREAAAGVGGVVKAAVMEAAVEVVAGCGSGGWRRICGWYNGGQRYLVSDICEVRRSISDEAKECRVSSCSSHELSVDGS
ncbi:hypothetical protein Tco_0393839 [Tanacetum coccineum]